MVTCSIQNNDTLRSLLEKEKFTVACVGGGPGSDFLGILKYLERNGGCGMRHLKCHLIDQEKAWDNCWSDLDEEIRSTARLSTHFKPIDVTDPTSYDPVEDTYMRADLFTFVYFMSELYARRNSVKAYFQNLFRRMRRGATMLYLDNSSREFSSWFDSFTQTPTFVGEKWDRAVFQMPRDEQKKVLAEYLDKFGDVKLTGRVACRVLVKK